METLKKRKGKKVFEVQLQFSHSVLCSKTWVGCDASNSALGSPIRPEVGQLEEIKGKFGSNN